MFGLSRIPQPLVHHNTSTPAHAPPAIIIIVVYYHPCLLSLLVSSSPATIATTASHSLCSNSRSSSPPPRPRRASPVPAYTYSKCIQPTPVRRLPNHNNSMLMRTTLHVPHPLACAYHPNKHSQLAAFFLLYFLSSLHGQPQQKPATSPAYCRPLTSQKRLPLTPLRAVRSCPRAAIISPARSPC